MDARIQVWIHSISISSLAIQLCALLPPPQHPESIARHNREMYPSRNNSLRVKAARRGRSSRAERLHHYLPPNLHQYSRSIESLRRLACSSGGGLTRSRMHLLRYPLLKIRKDLYRSSNGGSRTQDQTTSKSSGQMTLLHLLTLRGTTLVHVQHGGSPLQHLSHSKVICYRSAVYRISPAPLLLERRSISTRRRIDPASTAVIRIRPACLSLR